MTEGKKQIPFATELETGKWLYDSDKCALGPPCCSLVTLDEHEAHSDAQELCFYTSMLCMCIQAGMGVPQG